MSLRQYRPRGSHHRGLSRRRTRILWGLVALAIFLQILYPLVHGGLLRGLTLAIVYVSAAAMCIHSLYSFGSRYFLTYICITGSYAFIIEAIGVKSGWPFGSYHYDSTLGFAIAGVPILVPFAWMMLAHPLLVAARRIARGWIFLYGGIALMAWDLFLDPQMVEAHRWIWKTTKPAIPLEPMIPLSNAAGWLFAGMGLMGLLNALLPKVRMKNGAGHAAADVILMWTLFSGVIGNLFFFHRTGTAVLAGLIFGAVVTPYFFSLRFGRPEFL